MQINILKLNLVLASQCKTTADLRPGVSPQTLRKIRQGESVRPDVVGRIAKSLGVDVFAIIQEEA